MCGYVPLANSASINVAGRQLIVIQPEGNCWLDMNGSESPMARQAAEIYAKTSQELLAMFSDCNELKALRAGRTTTLMHHGNLTAFTDRRGAVRLTKRSRAEYIDSSLKSIATSTRRTVDDVLTEANRALPGTVLTMALPRVIGMDENALYLGGIARTRTSTGRNRLVASVSAVSVLNGIEVNVVLYDEPRTEPYSFVQLLGRSKALMSEHVRANP